ncbi:caspase, EACC1-associated type [Streptomyces sp. NPDC004752]
MGLPDPAASRAVVIGVDSYVSLAGLPSVANNVTGIAGLLCDPDVWGLPAEHCVLLPNPVSPVDVVDVVQAAAAQARDAFLLYFAGHGLPSPEGGLHLALPDSHADRLHHAVEYSRLRHVLVNACPARSRVVILDCCYSGGAMEGHLGATADFADHTLVEGTYVMTACAETKKALAPPDEEYTAFTGELLRTLGEGIPAGPDLLDMNTLYWHVRRRLIGQDRPVPQQRARGAGHSITLVRNRWTGARTPEALAYAEALRGALGPAEERWGAGRPLADALGTPAATLDRYLRGGAVAPGTFLDGLAALLAGQGLGPPDDELARLHGLRRRAQRADPDAETRLLHWQEEVDRLRAGLTRAVHERRALDERSGTRLSALDARLATLEAELAATTTRAETAEAERDAARTAVDGHRRRLDHARDYTRRMADDLAARQEQVRLLRREVQVLREQVERLLTEPAPHPAPNPAPNPAAHPAPNPAPNPAAHLAPNQAPASGADRPTALVDAVPAAQMSARTGPDTDRPPPDDAPPDDPPPDPGERPETPRTPPTRRDAPGWRDFWLLLVALCLGYVLCAWLITFAGIPLTHTTGRAPATAPTDEKTYVWDVRDDVTTTFRPGRAGAVDGLQGRLSLSVPADCADRTLHWRITVDGVRKGAGDLTGRRSYDVSTDYGLDRTPDRITVDASWDGGTGACSSFGLIWHEPELSRKFDVWFVF